MSPDLIAIFGPTGVGKTGVAVELSEALRSAGEDPVAVNADALQVYRGIEILTGAPSTAEQERLEHRLIGVADPSEEFSAGRFAALAHAEIDALRAAGRRPILIGGTGLYLRAAISELDLRSPVDSRVRSEVEADLERRGSPALHAELSEPDRSAVHPNDRKRVARMTELRREGIDPPRGSEQLWTERPRVPTALFGLTMERHELRERISRRVEAMADAGAADEARAVMSAGASRTVAAAIGFEAFAVGDLGAVKAAHWRYARRQMTWMRKLPEVHLIDRTGLTDTATASQIKRAMTRSP